MNPEPSHLFLTIEVIQELKDVSPPVKFLRLEVFRKLHIKIILDRRLWIRQHKINLSGVPLVDGCKG